MRTTEGYGDDSITTKVAKQRRCKHTVLDACGNAKLQPDSKKCSECARIRKRRSREASDRLREALRDETWVAYYVLLWGRQGVCATEKRVHIQLKKNKCAKVSSHKTLVFVLDARIQGFFLQATVTHENPGKALEVLWPKFSRFVSIEEEVWVCDAFAGNCTFAQSWSIWIKEQGLRNNLRWILRDIKEPPQSVLSTTVADVRSLGGEVSWGDDALDPHHSYDKKISGFILSPPFNSVDPFFIKFVSLQHDFVAFLLWERFVGKIEGDPPERRKLYESLVEAKRVVRIPVLGKEANLGPMYGQLVWFVFFKNARRREWWMPGVEYVKTV